MEKVGCFGLCSSVWELSYSAANMHVPSANRSFFFSFLSLLFVFVGFVCVLMFSSQSSSLNRIECVIGMIFKHIQHVWVIKLIDSYDKIQTLSKYLKHVANRAKAYFVTHSHAFGVWLRYFSEVCSVFFLFLSLSLIVRPPHAVVLQ